MLQEVTAGSGASGHAGDDRSAVPAVRGRRDVDQRKLHTGAGMCACAMLFVSLICIRLEILQKQNFAHVLTVGRCVDSLGQSITINEQFQ